MSPPRRDGPVSSLRRDGFVPIEDYAVIGDGRTVALVARDGGIDWWPAPTLDAPPILSTVVDPEGGGTFVLVPTEAFDVERRYLPGTNVLETTYTTAAGRAKVLDSVDTGAAGRLPWTEVARRVDGVEGSVTFRWAFRPGNRFGAAEGRLTGNVWSLGDQMIGVVTDAGDGVDGGMTGGTLAVAGGESHVVALVATTCEPLFLPDPESVMRRVDRTAAAWERWSGLLGVDEGGRWHDAVVRSALALKTLLAEHTGAIAAAATTSLPERVGGDKNWDYRFAWVRDSSFTLDALINLGLHEEVHGAVSWLLGALRRNGGKLHVFYDLEGNLPGGEDTLDVRGYRDSLPVRSGNGAATQSQLGCYGDLMDTVHRYCAEGHLLDPGTQDLLTRLLDECADSWQEKDSGIWELQAQEHYTISKIGCWVAFDRAARLADDGLLPEKRAGRWREEADAVRAWIDQHCWSERRRSYTSYAGTEDLDAAVLLAARTGFDHGERLAGTIAAVAEELGRGPCVYRYSGMEAEEGAFVACTFWMVDALAAVGRLDDATRLMDEAVGLANDVGLLAEQIDPATRAFLGNIPQGLSHLALINAAYSIRRAEERR